LDSADANSLAYLLDNLTTVGVLGLVIFAMLKRWVVTSGTLKDTTVMYEQRLIDQRELYEARLKEKDTHCANMSALHEKELKAVQAENDQQVQLLKQVHESDQRRYQTAITALEALNNTEDEAAKLVRTLAVIGEDHA
jgi:translation initiation factor 1 (eIF-1/SUI1)